MPSEPPWRKVPTVPSRMRRIGWLVVVLALVLGACTPVDDGAREPEVRPSASATRTGGTVDVGILGEPATLDPYSPAATDLTYALARPLYPSLFRFAPDGSTYPDLAASIRSHDRGVVVELETAQWSNGRHVDARDVVASVKRALPPSGFARLKAAALNDREIHLTGPVRRWETTLARAAFILPRGRASRTVSGGPLTLVRRVRGREIVYRARPSWGPIGIDRLHVHSYLDSGSMTDAIVEGALDVAAVPSTINLEDRVPNEVTVHRATGWEAIWMDVSRSMLSFPQREALAAALDRAGLEEGFIRSDGRVSNTLTPGPGSTGARGSFRVPEGTAPPPDLSLAIPEGDELLSLIRRAVQVQLAPQTRVDLVTLDLADFYGRPDGIDGVRIVRSSGAPGWEGRDAGLRGFNSIPLFHVDTFALSARVDGIEVNPTLEGLLWNVDRWSQTETE